MARSYKIPRATREDESDLQAARRHELEKRYSKRVQGLSLFQFLVERPDLAGKRKGRQG